MELANETKRVVSLFDYSDKDLNKGVQEFLRQMSALPAPVAAEITAD